MTTWLVRADGLGLPISGDTLALQCERIVEAGPLASTTTGCFTLGP